MTDPSEEPLRFKFHWLGENGQQTSTFRKQGQFDGEILTLEDVHVPAAVIVHVELRDNLPTLLGKPVALMELYRSYSGGGVGGPFKGLDTGNIKARKGDFSGALSQYRAILERVPQCAGVKYNLGLALRQQNKPEQAADSFRIALEDCANYAPAYAHLRELYQQLGMTAELEELQAQWEDPEPDEDQSPADTHDGN